jgi:hypothetical protein
MRTLFLATLLGMTIPVVAATNETATLLKAHRVPHALYVRVSGGGLEYAIDTPTDFLTLQDGDTFTGQTQVDFAYPKFNPFTIKIETSQDLRDDPTSAAVASLLQKVVDTAGTVLPNPAEQPAAGSPVVSSLLKDQTQNFAFIMNDAALLPSPQEKENGALPDCSAYEALHVLLIRLRAKMNVEIVTAAEASHWVELADSASGVRTVRQNIGKRIKEIDSNEETILALLKTINEKFGVSVKDDKDDKKFEAKIKAAFEKEATCGSIRASTLAALLDISQLASQARAKKLAVRSNLQDLNKALEPFIDDALWRDTTSFVFLKPMIDPAKVDAITVKISKRDLDNDKLTFTDAVPVKKKLDLRQYQRIIPEVAAAIIYTDLTYPTWGTASDGNGHTVVAPGKAASFPVQGAMVLNGVFPSGVASIYPAIQFGVSTAKEFPGFLAGIALRSVGTKQFSLSVGKMQTWYRTLSTLHSGSIVTGTADIEKDMKLKRAPLAWYGGVQYSF